MKSTETIIEGWGGTVIGDGGGGCIEGDGGSLGIEQAVGG